MSGEARTQCCTWATQASAFHRLTSASARKTRLRGVALNSSFEIGGARIASVPFRFWRVKHEILNNPAQHWLGRLYRPETQDASAALRAGDDLVFVGSEGCQDFVLLTLRDLGEVQAFCEFLRDRIEFVGRDLEVSMGLLKPKQCLARLGGRELEGPTRSVGDPQRPLELEPGQPFQVFGVPFPQLPIWNSGRRRDSSRRHR
jgi:hypothetical protein